MSPDPYLWLEDVQGDRALAWVRERDNAQRARMVALEYAFLWLQLGRH